MVGGIAELVVAILEVGRKVKVWRRWYADHAGVNGTRKVLICVIQVKVWSIKTSLITMHNEQIPKSRSE